MHNSKFTAKNSNFPQVLMVSLVFFLPFMINNLPYNDDYYKSLWGQSHFIEDGRPFAELVIRSFSFFSHTINNISPLTWIISSILLGSSCYFVCKRTHGNKSFILFFASLLIFISPNYIDNSMYRYDVLTMSLSLSVAIISATVLINNTRSLFIVLFGNFVYFCTYQLSVSAFVIISMLFFVVNISNDKDKKPYLLDLLLKAVSLIASYLVYNAVKPLMHISKYAREMGEMANISDMPGHLYGSAFGYINRILGLYDTPSILAIAIAFSLSFVYVFIICLKIIKTKDVFIIKLFSCLALILIMPCSLFFIFSPIAMLKRQPDTLRMMIGLGSFIYLCISLSWYLLKDYKVLKHTSTAITIILLVYTLSVTYAVNNAYKAQYILSNGISLNVLSSIGTADAGDIKEINYTVTGGPLAYETERVRNDHPFTKQILKDGFTALPHWAGYTYQSSIKVGEWFSKSQTSDACGGFSIVKGVNYDIYRKDDIIYVDLTKSKCK